MSLANYARSARGLSKAETSHDNAEPDYIEGDDIELETVYGDTEESIEIATQDFYSSRGSLIKKGEKYEKVVTQLHDEYKKMYVDADEDGLTYSWGVAECNHREIVETYKL